MTYLRLLHSQLIALRDPYFSYEWPAAVESSYPTVKKAITKRSLLK